ncbi:DNA helicase RecQ [Dendrosporobacter sp. 1207_IL3150]|uniref:DNA helicase RecQ n=1 Tax=Dendrosporobacter sp. 1207_IL3150 TaxID=3084054 RepID=UPI002FDA885E
MIMEKAKEILKKYYGYSEFRPGQTKIIESLLAGRDTMAIMPTGAGKSICFQIPAMLLPGVTIVISPLISLMKDQVDGLSDQGISATYINSTLSAAEVRQRLARISAGYCKLIYVAPERLEVESFQAALRQLNISLVAIDEAHCVSQWGHDFRPGFRNISPFIANLPLRPVIGAFTATATEEVKGDVVSLLSLKQPDVYVTGFDRPNLSFTVLRGEDKQKYILNYLKSNSRQAGIIYAATRKEVDGLYELLLKRGIAVGRYHAGLSDDERAVQQECFIYDDIRVMVATNAFGMGIDKSNVRYVIHYNMPKNMESYYQEAGRSGRDGEPGECILLFSAQDTLLQKFLIDKSVENPARKQHELRKLQQMVDYCHTPECLRQYILRYFGETVLSGECGNCGNCEEEGELIDITLDAQKVFSCVYRMKERFGVAMIADVLKGSKNKKVQQFGLDQLPTYGLMSEYTVQDLKTLVQRLVATQYLSLTEGEYPIVKLTPQAFAVLKNLAGVWQKGVKQRKMDADDGLFELLRQLRKSIAEREQVPPYLIFADSTLKEMSKYCPKDEGALRQIKGVGELKLKKYGAEFLQLIRENTDDILKPTVTEVTPKESKKEKASHLITLEQFQQGQDLEQIAHIRGLTLSTVQNHLNRCSSEGYEVDWDRLIPKQYEDLIVTVINNVGAAALRPIKEALPEEIGYAAIKAVIGKHFCQKIS